MHATAAVMLIAGSACMLASHLVMTSPCKGECEDEFPADVWAPLGIGMGLLVAGSPLLIVSQVRRTRYRKWKGPHFVVSPTGVQIGWSGRF